MGGWIDVARHNMCSEDGLPYRFARIMFNLVLLNLNLIYLKLIAFVALLQPRKMISFSGFHS